MYNHLFDDSYTTADLHGVTHRMPVKIKEINPNWVLGISELSAVGLDNLKTTHLGPYWVKQYIKLSNHIETPFLQGEEFISRLFREPGDEDDQDETMEDYIHSIQEVYKKHTHTELQYLQ